VKYLDTRIRTEEDHINTNKKGLEIIGITEVKEGKLSEALARVYNYLREFWDIDGFSYKVEVMPNLQEGFEVLGL